MGNGVVSPSRVNISAQIGSTTECADACDNGCDIDSYVGSIVEPKEYLMANIPAHDLSNYYTELDPTFKDCFTVRGSWYTIMRKKAYKFKTISTEMPNCTSIQKGDPTKSIDNSWTYTDIERPIEVFQHHFYNIIQVLNPDSTLLSAKSPTKSGDDSETSGGDNAAFRRMYLDCLISLLLNGANSSIMVNKFLRSTQEVVPISEYGIIGNALLQSLAYLLKDESATPPHTAGAVSAVVISTPTAVVSSTQSRSSAINTKDSGTTSTSTASPKSSAPADEKDANEVPAVREEAPSSSAGRLVGVDFGMDSGKDSSILAGNLTPQDHEREEPLLAWTRVYCRFLRFLAQQLQERKLRTLNTEDEDSSNALSEEHCGEDKLADSRRSWRSHTVTFPRNVSSSSIDSMNSPMEARNRFQRTPGYLIESLGLGASGHPLQQRYHPHIQHQYGRFRQHAFSHKSNSSQHFAPTSP
eukprot:CAMPEP_0174957794 /NCGR_PEP_ID=MMETSP0004_2-20121128/2269_1 /TAXON_ID=420556 /ORGANISM="Ochromonas sp., Strain CCMP1393" /LENGTH=468 /DNA_ID=CAMNT_0016205941 /DNA_START=58 /DNA_END=1465 /DNA_ORIENTATION=+